MFRFAISSGWVIVQFKAATSSAGRREGWLGDAEIGELRAGLFASRP